MKKLLLTGFEPFLSHVLNPSETVVRELDGERTGEVLIVGKVLPVSFARAPEALITTFNSESPDIVVMLGLAAGRKHITPERVAINIKSGEADEDGAKYIDEPLAPSGPAAYFSTLPLREIIQVLQDHGYPARISNTCGTYLCNAVMYQMLHELAVTGRHIPAGFIHLPASHEQVIAEGKDVPSWSQNQITDAIRCVAEVF